MTIVRVPEGIEPGVFTARRSLGTACDIGPSRDNKRGAGRLEVTIKPADPVGSPITLDDAGMAAHLLWEFARPSADVGRRRRTLPPYQPEDVEPVSPILIESDGGVFWVGSEASLWIVGGTPGDVYEVTVTQDTPYDVPEDAAVDVWEPAFEATLSAVFNVAAVEPHADGFIDLPYVPDYMWGIRVATGQARILLPSANVVPLEPRKRAYSLALGRIQVSTGVYEFVGGM